MHPPVWGLVLSGGRSHRMRRDKGCLDIHGLPQAAWTFNLLGGVCDTAFVSIARDQGDADVYGLLPTLEDEPLDFAGPARGLVSAWRRYPEVAWLAVGVDMPYLRSATLEILLASREPALIATAFSHSDGTIEPMCTIWEPAAISLLEQRANSGDCSPRRLLQNQAIKSIGAPQGRELLSVNTPDEYATARVETGLASS